MPALFSLGTLLGRLAIVGIFASSVPSLIERFGGFSERISGYGIPLADVVVVIGIGFVIAGSLLIILGWWARLGALLLMTFLVVATLMAHNVFINPDEQIQFAKNAAIFGGLLMILAVGPGPISLGARKRKLVIEA